MFMTLRTAHVWGGGRGAVLRLAGHRVENCVRCVIVLMVLLRAKTSWVKLKVVGMSEYFFFFFFFFLGGGGGGRL